MKTDFHEPPSGTPRSNGAAPSKRMTSGTKAKRKGPRTARTTREVDADDWTELRPLTGPQPVTPFPITRAFPPGLTDLHDYVLSVSEALQVPVELAAMLLLPASAVAAAKKVEIRLAPGWHEPAALWTLVLLPSGERKSAAVQEMLAPIHAWEREEAVRLAPVISEQREAIALREAKLKKLRAAASGKDPAKAEAAREQALALAQELDAEVIIPAPQLITTEPTPEAIAKLLVDNRERLLVASAEGDALDVMLGRYNRGAENLGIYLCGHSGDPVRVDRRGREPDHLERPALSVALAVQPEAVEALFGSRQARGRGLLNRFLKAAPPSNLGSRRTDPAPVPENLRSRYAARLRALLDLPVPGEPRVIGLSKKAAGLFDVFRAGIEVELAPRGELGDEAGWGSKLPGAIGRIALVLHALENGGDSARCARDLQESTMRAALAWSRWLTEQERHVAGVVGADMATSVARRIIGWLQRTSRKSFSRRDAFTACRRADLLRVDEIDEPLALLEETGHIRPEPAQAREGAGRPASPVYEVNPEVRHLEPAS